MFTPLINEWIKINSLRPIALMILFLPHQVLSYMAMGSFSRCINQKSSESNNDGSHYNIYIFLSPIAYQQQ